MSYAFTDTHCHFDFPPFTGHEGESLVRAASAGVTRIIVPTVTADRFARVLRLAQDHAPLFAALGLHPLYIAQHHEPQLEQLAALLAERPRKLVAVGEVGLDLYMDNPQFERQQSVLLAQLRLAKQHDLPVILHSRRTHDQLAAALR
ncbi:TatD family hydrolase, partial [Serratia marcescens]